MNDKGFTLIELLGVIVVLSIIALITISVIDSSLRKGKDNLSVAQRQQIIKALKDYYADYRNSRDLNLLGNGEEICKTINDLKSSGYLPVDVRNPLNNKDYASDDKVCVQKECDGSCDSDTYENNISYDYCISIGGSVCE